jgi:cell division protein FtsI/penicillin-binding protein 2
MKKLRKFSGIAPINIERREFISILMGIPFFPSIAEASNLSSYKHFYVADLKQNSISLPDQLALDKGGPGSLMKLIASAAIAEENLPASSQSFDCRGSIMVGRARYICRYPHGRVTLTEALGQSCNVFFANSSTQLNFQCFWHYLDKFGLGQSLISAEKPQKHSSTDFILGIANGFELSALQILQLVTTIAKKGVTEQLRCNDHPGSSITLPVVRLREHTWNVLSTGMQIASQRGTAKHLDPDNKLRLSVKTGTTVHGKTFQSWLAGYFPYDSPRYSFCFRATVGTSYDQAIPLAKKILFSRDWT